jgi:D-arabinose 1-dehydrogenase-like Zn-dependent alcohol dehydrogenase
MTTWRRAPGSWVVEIEMFFCGVCHSDLHQRVISYKKGVEP